MLRKPASAMPAPLTKSEYAIHKASKICYFVTNSKDGQDDSFENLRSGTKASCKIAPLFQDRYKLTEGQHALHLIVSTLGRREKAPTPHYDPLKRSLKTVCLDNEFGVWVKCVHTIITDIFDYDIIPAIEALKGDGLPPTEVSAIIAASQSAITTLLHEAENVRGGIPSKGLPKQNLEASLELVKAAVEIVDRIYARVEYYRSETV
ncbi:hypothetical protein N9C18_01300 [Planktomarina temperata]|nr:hypothetical protein [Planktomarina temperata]